MRAGAWVALAFGVEPLPAQTPAPVEMLAALLASEDARRYDATLLRRAAAAPDSLVRLRAALAAGRIGDQRAGPVLVSLLGDTVPSVGASAAFGIGLLHDSSLVGALVARLQRGPLDSATAAEVIGALAKSGGRRASVILARLLDRELEPGGDGARSALASALLEAWRLPADPPIAALRRYARDPDPELRWRAVYSLARMRPPDAAAELLAASLDSHAVARMYALRALTERYVSKTAIDSGDVKRVLASATSDAAPGVRAWALLALGTWRDSTLVPAAAARFDDTIPNVQVQAATALGQLGGRPAVLALAAAHGHAAVWAVRREALLALARADTGAYRLVAVPWQRSSDWRERAAAAEGWALARSSDAPRWRHDPDGRVVAAGLQAWLGEADSNDAAILAAARELVSHSDGGVRSVAADALARAPSPSDIPALVGAFRAAAGDSFPEAAQSAVAALAAIASRDDSSAELVRRAFLRRVGPPRSYLLRRWAVEHWPEAATRWGPAVPIPTGRSRAEYHSLVRRRLLGDGRRPRVRIETAQLGSIDVELLGDEAPLTVERFLGIVDRSLRDGGRWHRVVPNFVVQDGDPRGDGWGGPPVAGAPVHAWAIRDELNRIRYAEPVLGMALSGPDTGNGQWFINLSPQPHLDGTYTVFGRVLERGGLDRIAQGDSIVAVYQVSAPR
ncbi:MAG TPA: HEAT repeat domain-containing protein [Gemmatimonadales bacterium]|nr:HEAT repeat domain-containing protein [Gemmatimonadales bacterium]